MVELILSIILNKPLDKKLTPLEVFRSTDYRKGGCTLETERMRHRMESPDMLMSFSFLSFFEEKLEAGIARYTGWVR